MSNSRKKSKSLDISSDKWLKKTENTEADISKSLEKKSESIMKNVTWFLLVKYMKMCMYFIPMTGAFGYFIDKNWKVWSWPALWIGFFAICVGEYENCKFAITALPKAAYNVIDKDKNISKTFKILAKSASTCVFSTCSFCILQITVMIWLYNHYYLKETYEREDYLMQSWYMSSFMLSCAFVCIYSEISSTCYSKPNQYAMEIIGSNKYNIGGQENAAILSNLQGNLISGIGYSLVQGFFNLSIPIIIGVVILSSSPQCSAKASSVYFPLVLHSGSLVLNIFLSIFFFTIISVNSPKTINSLLKMFYIISGLCSIVFAYMTIQYTFIIPCEFIFGYNIYSLDSTLIFYCLVVGQISGMLLSFLLEKITSQDCQSSKDAIESCNTGEGTGIILGLSFGFQGCLYSTTILVIAVTSTYYIGGFFGIYLACLGNTLNLPSSLILQILSSNSTCTSLLIESLNIKSESTCRIYEINDITDKNLSLPKGITLLSTGFIGVTSLYFFAKSINLTTFNILSPLEFVAILIGATIPYFFSALLLLKVGQISQNLSLEVQVQCQEWVKNSNFVADYTICHDISSKKANKAMRGFFYVCLGIWLVVMFFLGNKALFGMLLGVIISGFMLESSAFITNLCWKQCSMYFYNYFASSDIGRSIKTTTTSINIIGECLKDAVGGLSGALVGIFSVFALLSGCLVTLIY
ncbi:hypothetical protein SteCoe_17359 [Stentor coeruleus]|uniref:H(+)-exporting diphosphatase n=1 Tax=Stentor coeruleus TaxID=5963 RepID=A0A1R2BZ15_9CILI|nr:hypothetical protein SteCoe_17359 [Stentor coeruleus]